MASMIRQIPLHHRLMRTKILDHATVNLEDYDRVSKFVYFLNQATRIAYRIDPEMPTNPMTLHRDVMECSYGDGRRLTTQDGNFFNCTRENLIELFKKGEEAPTVQVAAVDETSKVLKWPHRFSKFKKHLEDNYPDLYDILQHATKINFSTSKVCYSFSELTEQRRASHHTVRVRILDVLKNDFGFTGDLAAPVFDEVIPVVPPKKSDSSILAKPSWLSQLPPRTTQGTVGPTPDDSVLDVAVNHPQTPMQTVNPSMSLMAFQMPAEVVTSDPVRPSQVVVFMGNPHDVARTLASFFQQQQQK